jgi:hypothetical protein
MKEISAMPQNLSLSLHHLKYLHCESKKTRTSFHVTQMFQIIFELLKFFKKIKKQVFLPTYNLPFCLFLTLVIFFLIPYSHSLFTWNVILFLTHAKWRIHVSSIERVNSFTVLLLLVFKRSETDNI